MGKHKKNKPTPPPSQSIKEGSDPVPLEGNVFTDFINPLTPEKIFEVKKEDVQEGSQTTENEFKEEENIAENLVEREENENSEDRMQELKEQGKTLGEAQEEKPQPVKSGRISFSEMLRNRRKSTKRN